MANNNGSYENGNGNKGPGSVDAGSGHTNPTMTTDSGRPVGDNQNSTTAGRRGPLLGEDYLLFEKMAQFNRERVPERVVHAKGSGAHRPHFTVTARHFEIHERQAVFEGRQQLRNVSRGSATVGGEKGSADTARDPRGFCAQILHRRRQLGHGRATTLPSSSSAIR